MSTIYYIQITVIHLNYRPPYGRICIPSAISIQVYFVMCLEIHFAPPSFRIIRSVRLSDICNLLSERRSNDYRLYVVNPSCSRPPEGVLGATPPTNFYICSLVLQYFIDITQLHLVSQPETVISAVTTCYFYDMKISMFCQQRTLAELC